jgi:shikimate kinase
VLDGDSRRALRGCGCVVWLDATPATLARRVERQHVERPLLAGSAAPVSLDRLARTRAPAYEATAHVRIDTEGRTVDQVVELVLKELAQCAA